MVKYNFLVQCFGKKNYACSVLLGIYVPETFPDLPWVCPDRWQFCLDPSKICWEPAAFSRAHPGDFHFLFVYSPTWLEDGKSRPVIFRSEIVGLWKGKIHINIISFSQLHSTAFRPYGTNFKEEKKTFRSWLSSRGVWHVTFSCWGACCCQTEQIESNQPTYRPKAKKTTKKRFSYWSGVRLSSKIITLCPDYKRRKKNHNA